MQSLTDMDAWQRRIDQWVTLLRTLSSAQRISLLAVAACAVAGCGWIVWSSTNPSDEPLLGGRNLTTTELAETQAALRAAGLTQFRVVGQQIFVPSAEVDRYMAAAASHQTLPAQFAAEFDRMQSKVNLFTTGEQRRELLEEARKSRLAQILRSIPEIEDAVVEWDRPRQMSVFRKTAALAAHVSVKPRHGRELSTELIKSLKLFVAGALAGAEPDDVTVVDMNTSRVFGRRSAADILRDQVAETTRQREQHYTTQITQALDYIPDLQVKVSVELTRRTDTARAHSRRAVPVSHQVARYTRNADRPLNRQRSRAHRPFQHQVSWEPEDSMVLEGDEFLSEDAIPFEPPEFETLPVHSERVLATISIPDTYYERLAREQGVGPGLSLETDSAYRAHMASLKLDTQQEIRDIVGQLLPADETAMHVAITTYSAHNMETEPQPPPTVTTTLQKLPVDFQDWKTQAGLILAGLGIGLGMLTQRTRRIPKSIVLESSLPVTGSSRLEDSVDDEPIDGPTTNSDTERPVIEDEYPAVAPHPHAAVFSELAELERRSSAQAIVRLTPFDFLQDLSSDAISTLLMTEHPQTVALIATALPPALAAELLHSLPESFRREVSQRLTRTGPVSPEILNDVAAALRQRLTMTAPVPATVRSVMPSVVTSPVTLPVTSTVTSTVTVDVGCNVPHDCSPVAPLMTQSLSPDPDFTAPVHSKLSPAECLEEPYPATEHTPTLTTTPTTIPTTTEYWALAFEDIPTLDEHSLNILVEAIDRRVWAAALFDQSEAFRKSLLSRIFRPLAQEIQQHLRNLGPIRLTDMTAAQEAIALFAWQLFQAGQIHLPKHLERTTA